MTSRVGLGFDVHPFGAAPPLVLGGVTIADAPRLAGHSDGDAVAHAVADAMLGPTGLPDLGTSLSRYRRAVPQRRLDRVARPRSRCGSHSSGWWIENVDVTIAAETPRLAPHMDAMAAHLGAALAPLRGPQGVTTADGIAVSVRPKRGEGLGAIGRAEGIAVWAVVLLSRS